jgi:hypothetical protein
MKRRSPNRIKLQWMQEAPFRVPLNRVVPKARRAPEAFVDFFIPREEEAWRTASFIL